MQYLKVTAEEGVAVVTIDRPPVNALNRQVMAELDQALEAVKTDAAVKVVILTGGGSFAFVAGADVKEIASLSSGREAAEVAARGQAVMTKIQRLGKPVIAAINGHALGGGCEISMACHIRILKDTARMGQTESNLGIIPGYGGTQRLPRLIPVADALRLLILGTQIPGADALQLGLVNKLSKDGESLNDAKTLARQLGKRAPIATRLILEVVDEGLNTDIDHGLAAEIRAFVQVLKTEDAAEGIQAFFQKRPAEFKGK
ncbi:MAG TPA: hypothetical protein DD714_07790 [Candidatus Omnitrophica bacterium]|nr:hypothetical protein [Candidatus Omnitrophota bacterium]